MLRPVQQQSRCAARIALMLCCVLSARETEDAYAAFEFACNLVIIDYLVMYTFWEHSLSPAFDEHCPSVAVGVARIAGMTRAQGDYLRDENTRLVLELAWCVCSLSTTLVAKQEGAKRSTLYCVLNVQLLVMCLLTPAPLDDCALFSARAALFSLLTACLYAHVPEHDCLIASRGYLICFLPVLFVTFPAAVAFALLSVAAVVVGDVSAMQEWPRPVVVGSAAYEPVHVI